MSRRSVILLILTLLLAVATDNADAAARKKKKSKKHSHKRTEQVSDASGDTTQHTRKEERKIHRRERKRHRHERKLRKRGYETESDYEYSKPASKPVAFKYPPTVMKSHYRVDILAAMYLDELVNKGEVTFKDKIPDKALPGLSFYEGMAIAADSLRKAGFNIDIYVHDITSAGESPDSLVLKNMLDSSDLIIGAIPAASIPPIAEYAKKKKINFVSALTLSDAGVKGNKYFTMIQPTLKRHCDWILDDLSTKFPGMKVALLYRTNDDADEHAYRYLAEGDGNVNFRQLACNTLPSKESLVPLFDTTRPNVVVVSVLEPMAADSILHSLSAYFPGAHFEVYGMPSWTSVADLRKESAFPNLSINVSAPFNIDVNSPAGRYVSKMFRNNYGGTASEYVYRGFEAMFWYASLLKQYGTIFNNNYSDNSAAPFTRFDVKQLRDKDGRILYNENTHIFISKYEGGFSRTE